MTTTYPMPAPDAKHGTDEAVRLTDQVTANTLADQGDRIAALCYLIDALRRHLAEFPQYEHCWTDPRYVLVQFTEQVVSKGGVSFEAGDVAIAERHLGFGYGESRTSAYSTRRGVHCSVRYGFDVIFGESWSDHVDTDEQIEMLEQWRDECRWCENGGGDVCDDCRLQAIEDEDDAAREQARDTGSNVALIERYHGRREWGPLATPAAVAEVLGR